LEEKMKTKNKTIVFVLLIVLAAYSIAYSLDTKQRDYQVNGFGILELHVPISWAENIKPSEGVPAKTIEYTNKGSLQFSIQITPIWPEVTNINLNNQDSIKNLVVSAARKAKEQAVETNIPVKQFKGGNKIGYYFTATDRAPGPGEFKYMTQGVMTASQYGLLFTILTNDYNSKHINDALSLLLTANRSK
jgi:hypothetical protein